MSKATNIATILRGPHKKTLLAGAGNPPLVEIEPMKFMRVYWRHSQKRAFVSRSPAA